MDISIIIPAYNEEAFISNTIQSIRKRMPSSYLYEVIVVNHGSTDGTATIADHCGAVVIDGSAERTIASLRNLGVKHSTGKLLFFIDADITFSKAWSDHISTVIEDLYDNPNQICGSLPKAPENSSIMMKYWFEPRTLETSPRYIGSCHLLTSRDLFEKTGGFPKEMETAEEFTFCGNATKLGATISAKPDLIVTHHGVPETLLDFARREIWHGRGDWTNVSSVIASKVALLSLIFITLHTILFIYIFSKNMEITVVFSLSILISLLCLGASIMKYSKYGARFIALNTVTFYIYFFARSLSLFSAAFAKKYKKRTRG